MHGSPNVSENCGNLQHPPVPDVWIRTVGNVTRNVTRQRHAIATSHTGQLEAEARNGRGHANRVRLWPRFPSLGSTGARIGLAEARRVRVETAAMVTSVMVAPAMEVTVLTCRLGADAATHGCDSCVIN